MLKLTEQVLSTQRTQPQLIVLHLMGSHPQACDRTKGKYTVFVQSKETSCYLYSMTQTDSLLAKLYHQLQNSGDTFSLTYFSDHGLAFMVLSSDDKAHKVIKAQRSANDFLSFFSQWTGIQAAEITPRYRFISEQKAGPVYITNFQLQKVDYAHLGTDEFTVN